MPWHTKKPRVLKLLCVVSFEAIDSLQNAFLNETAISDGKRAVSEGKVCPLGIARGIGIGSVVALADPRMKLCREFMKQGVFSAWVGGRRCPARRGEPACV